VSANFYHAVNSHIGVDLSTGKIKVISDKYPVHGRVLRGVYGCAGCHTIPAVTGARGQVGTNLQGVSRRVYLGGAATNTPDNLIRWIVNPREIDPKTAMPVTGISTREARDIAAYLYSR
jgi:cytochrome c